MQKLMEVRLPDGETIWAKVEVPGGPQDTGILDGSARALRGLDLAVRAVAANVRQAVAEARPDEVSVEFGLELAVGKDGLVAALAGTSGTATISVTLTWTAPGDTGAAQAQGTVQTPA